MARTKPKPPVVLLPAIDDPEEKERLRGVEEFIAGLHAAATFEIPDDGVTVRHGDGSEAQGDYAAHRDGLAANYGVEGAIEIMLLDRVAALSWRIQRLQRHERGVIGVRAHGIVEQQRKRRGHNLYEDVQALITTGRSVAEHDSPEVLDWGVHLVRQMCEQLEAGGDLAPKSASDALKLVFGTETDKQIKGRGQMLAGFLHALAVGLPDPEFPEVETLREKAPQIRAYVVRELREVERMLEAHRAVCAKDATTLSEAMVEAKSRLTGDDLKALGTYERHLGHELREAIRELEKAIARRRLAGVARRVEAEWSGHER